MNMVSVSPAVHARICKIAPDYKARREIAEIFERIPDTFTHRFLKEYEARAETQGRHAANQYARSLKDEILPELFADTALPFQASDSDIIEAAERAAERAEKCVRSPTDELARAALARLARRYRVAMPECKTFAGTAARMIERAWWRRALRKRFRHVEHAAIRAGLVRGHSPYVTDEAMRRHQHHSRKTARLLESMDAINMDTGEAIPLSEIAERSLSNPTNRRAAVMVQIRGLEEYAKSVGYIGYMVALTVPSRMHAYYKKSGQPVKSYDGTSPRGAQGYLCRLWNSAMRKLERDGIKCMGIRTVEPHHDATPHWHVIIFVHPDRAGELLNTLRDYALHDSPNESGAGEARFHSTLIDPEKGSAARYVSAYISKNIDGHGVDTDHEADQPAEVAAPRAVVWARIWNLRQFQFFGCGPITPVRELYRLDSVPQALEQALGDAHRAVKAKAYGDYLKALQAGNIRLSNDTDTRESTRYPGEVVKRVCGVRINGAESVQTRFDLWVITRRAGAKSAPVCSSWTRFNNSAQIVLKEKSETNRGLDSSQGQSRCGVVVRPPWEPMGDAWTPPKIPDLWLRGAEREEWERRNGGANADWQADPRADRAQFGGQKKLTPESRTATN
jgi:hypothetical protein